MDLSGLRDFIFKLACRISGLGVQVRFKVGLGLQVRKLAFGDRDGTELLVRIARLWG